MSDESIDYLMARELIASLEAQGFCTNCGHTKECDVADVIRGLGSCRAAKNEMDHDCPPNSSRSAEAYDVLVMAPLRALLRRRIA